VSIVVLTSNIQKILATRRSSSRRQINLTLYHGFSNLEPWHDRETHAELATATATATATAIVTGNFTGRDQCFLGHAFHVDFREPTVLPHLKNGNLFVERECQAMQKPHALNHLSERYEERGVRDSPGVHKLPLVQVAEERAFHLRVYEAEVLGPRELRKRRVWVLGKKMLGIYVCQLLELVEEEAVAVFVERLSLRLIKLREIEALKHGYAHERFESEEAVTWLC